MATVRIYKVAELLDLQSTEVLALLKKEHGIELKSASSSLEEVVARSFVEREARQRNIALPSGDIFSDRPAAPKSALKKPQLAKKAPEPPKPTAPVLGPPRLVKSAKPAAAPAAPAGEPALEIHAGPGLRASRTGRAHGRCRAGRDRSAPGCRA